MKSAFMLSKLFGVASISFLMLGASAFAYPASVRSIDQDVLSHQTTPGNKILDTVTPKVATASLSTLDYLSPLEREIIAVTNQVRMNPAGYAEKLRQLRSHYRGNLVKFPGQPLLETWEGVSALEEAISALGNTSSLPPLIPSRGMSRATADHVNDLGPEGYVGHYGRDGSSPFTRMNRYGDWAIVPGESIAGENISYGPFTEGEWHVIQLLIDDGDRSRGHRNVILNPRYRIMGVSCGAHATYDTVCVIDYASHYIESH
ncbi:MAG: CAP domain-containing protein [Leptolyngbyaceae cyanobacterium MO_188.B28]|nr:CAP domain-containing protein [Leptolyngbyaceae cyanobacterium MO_188.B28]